MTGPGNQPQPPDSHLGTRFNPGFNRPAAAQQERESEPAA